MVSCMRPLMTNDERIIVDVLERLQRGEELVEDLLGLISANLGEGLIIGSRDPRVVEGLTRLIAELQEWSSEDC